MIPSRTRKALRAAAGAHIPADAVVVHGAAARALVLQLSPFGLSGDFAKSAADAFELLVIWDPFVYAEKDQPAGLLGIVDSSRHDLAPAEALVNFGSVFASTWQEPAAVNLLVVDGRVGSVPDFDWVLAKPV